MADEKIAALELALATLQGEVDAARTTASAASLQAASEEQRATAAEAQTARVQSGGGGLVDTRLLGRPKTFQRVNRGLEIVQVSVPRLCRCSEH